MDFPLFLAMTASEFAACPSFPQHIAYMSCYFSSAGTGLSGIPARLPAGSALMLTDQVPPNGHDPARIAGELSEAAGRLQCSVVFLDLQRPALEENAAVIEAVLGALPCPAAVSAVYAGQFSCGVMVPPPLLWTPLAAHLAPWKGRTVWLEAAIEGAEITVTKNGSTYAPCSCDPLVQSFHNDALQVDYQLELQAEQALFHLRRTSPCLQALLQSAKGMGVQGAIGLYQQLGKENAPL